MVAACDLKLEKIQCELLEEQPGGRVAIRTVARKEYDALEDQKKGRLQAIMKLWCEGRSLTPKMFNGNEGRTPRHNMLLQAFKTFKVRFYGFCCEIGGKRTFIIVDSDPAKKQDKADPAILKRAKRRIDDLIDDCRG
ncbi:hypothetical protein [Sphingopyxis granuli]|uniref:hypothetical protein n=1 Tax=Sphingopyxis granuli TaxID=267128 RepID=UPI001BAEFAB0|nr:hypothetical protein [Sphingopyxis granuli]QUM73040.1 hypothetical protein ICN83_03780 [Sphingopyxis granuli]